MLFLRIQRFLHTMTCLCHLHPLWHALSHQRWRKRCEEARSRPLATNISLCQLQSLISSICEHSNLHFWLNDIPNSSSMSSQSDSQTSPFILTSIQHIL